MSIIQYSDSLGVARFRCRCDQCGHEWIPRGSNLDNLQNRERVLAGSRCGKCKTRAWNIDISKVSTVALIRELVKRGSYKVCWVSNLPDLDGQEVSQSRDCRKELERSPGGPRWS